MVTRDYAGEEMPGGHFLPRAHPDLVGERLLAHRCPEADRPGVGRPMVGRKVGRRLSFDDGPDTVNTPKILDVLAAKNVKATFFICTNNSGPNLGDVNGNAALKALIQRIVNEGHQLASHSVHHYSLGTDALANTAAEVEAEITGVQQTVNRPDVLGPDYPKLTLFRAPYGEPYWDTTSAAYGSN